MRRSALTASNEDLATNYHETQSPGFTNTLNADVPYGTINNGTSVAISTEAHNTANSIFQEHLWRKRLETANKIIFGVYGSMYTITSAAGMLLLIEKRNNCVAKWMADNSPATIIACAIPALAGGISNTFQAPQATRDFFQRPTVTLTTLATMFVIGGYAALPFVAGLLQAAQVIDDRTHIPLTTLDKFYGNFGLLTGGISFSAGLINQMSGLLTDFRARAGNKTAEFIQKRNYLNSQRSLEELETFDPNTNSYRDKQFSWLNISLIPFALFAGLYFAWSVAPEIPDAIADRNDIVVMNATIPLESFAATSAGSKIIALSTFGLLFAAFAQDGLRTLITDGCHAFTDENNKCKNISTFIIYNIFVLCTCLTATLQAEESGANTFQLLLTLMSVFVVNRAGARQDIFERFLPWASSENSFFKHTHFIKAKNLREAKLEELDHLEDAQNRTLS